MIGHDRSVWSGVRFIITKYYEYYRILERCLKDLEHWTIFVQNKIYQQLNLKDLERIWKAAPAELILVHPENEVRGEAAGRGLHDLSRNEDLLGPCAADFWCMCALMRVVHMGALHNNEVCQIWRNANNMCMHAHPRDVQDSKPISLFLNLLAGVLLHDLPSTFLVAAA